MGGGAKFKVHSPLAFLGGLSASLEPSSVLNLRLTFFQILGLYEALIGNNLENRRTLFSRNSGKSSLTSVFLYFCGNIEAKGFLIGPCGTGLGGVDGGAGAAVGVAVGGGINLASSGGSCLISVLISAFCCGSEDSLGSVEDFDCSGSSFLTSGSSSSSEVESSVKASLIAEKSSASGFCKENYGEIN